MSKMNAIQTKVLQDAIHRLDTLGVKYAIVDLDGATHGELRLATPDLSVPSSRNNYRQYGYQAVVDAMQVGDVHVFDVPPGVPKENYRAAIQSRAISRLGRGSLMTTLNAAGQIEAMRVI